MNEGQRMRYEYFQAKGFGIPPTKQLERGRLAQKFVEMIPPNYEAAIMLFDPQEDSNDPQWINYMGYIYDENLRNPYFDPEKAVQFFIQGAKLRNPSSLFNMATKYFNGHETEIDHELALDYYKAAHDAGHYRAGTWIYEIANRFDERLFDPDHTEYRRQILQYLFESERRGSCEAQEIVAALCASGKGVEQNSSVTIDRYETAVRSYVNPGEERAKYKMVWRLALRTYLGLDIQQDSQRALEILSTIPKKSNYPYIQQTLNQDAQRLRKIIKRDNQSPQEYGFLRKSLAEIYERKINPKIKTGSTSKVDVLWCMKKLADGEGWLNRAEWSTALMKAQASNMGLSYEDILASTFFAGPSYNPISDNGLPVLGVWEPPSKNENQVEEQTLDQGSYVPESGVVKLKGVMCNRNGTLSFDFIKASDSPALLVSEDFEIAMALAYGNPDKPITPSLSLEAPSENGFNDEYDVFLHKLWGPKWLGYTDFGRTLYITDQLIGAICWCPKEFKVGAPNQTFHSGVSEFALELTEDITLTGGRSSAGADARVMLKPEHLSMPHTKDRNGNIIIKIAETKMRVDGSYIVNKGTDGENRLLALNDDMYTQGRTVNKLTARYNDIASLMPIFARAQELMALMHSIAQARKLGFKLNPNLQSRITKHYQELEALPPLPIHEQLCVNLPLKYERF